MLGTLLAPVSDLPLPCHVTNLCLCVRSGFVFIGPQPLALDWVRHPGRPKADHASVSLPLPLGSNASITLRFGMAMGQDSQEALQARLIK